MGDPDTRTLIEAIHDQRVPALAGSAAGADATTAAAVDACGRIGAQVADEVAALVEALRVAGVDAATDDDVGRPRSFHAGAITIGRADLVAAADVLAGHGLLPPFEATPGRFAAVAAFRPSLRFLRFDGHTTRITLELREPAPTRLPGPIRPTVLDIAGRDAPRWRYVLDRGARVLAGRLGATAAPTAENDFLGTPDALIEPVLAAAGVQADDIVMDLGCGDGRVAIEAARRFGCRAIGVEVVPDLAARARAAVDAAGVADRVEIREAPVQATSLADATVLFVFLPSQLVPAVVQRCLDTARPGARVIVHEQMRLPAELDPDESVPVVADDALTVAHLWRVGATASRQR